jgi:hypothetical protein
MFARGTMMHRRFSFAFPTHLILPKSRILIYGAGDMGRDYAKFIRETGYCEIVAFADRDYLNIPLCHSYEVVNPDRIAAFEYDCILIASTQHHEEIKNSLAVGGIQKEKVLYAEIRKPESFPSVVANLYLDYFLAKMQHRKMNPAFLSHPIHKILVESLNRYDKATILDSAGATRRLLDDFKACDNLSFSWIYVDERWLYGNVSALISYCGYDAKDIRKLPEVAHGVTIDSRHKNYRPDSPILVMSVCHRFLHCEFPIMECGPYINYASGYLDKAKIHLIKKKLGRTLTLFPAHTCFGWKISHDGDSLLEFVREESRQFDTLLVCLYFNDLTDEEIERYTGIGAKIVTAGVSADQYFLCKSRSILDLTDVAVVNTPHGSLSNCICMGKPVKWFDTNVWYSNDTALQGQREFEGPMETLLRELKSGEELSPAAIQRCRELYGHDKFKTPEEIRTIFEINVEIYDRAHGDMNRYPYYTQKYLEELSAGDDPDGKLKFGLLDGAWSQMQGG